MKKKRKNKNGKEAKEEIKKIKNKKFEKQQKQNCCIVDIIFIINFAHASTNQFTSCT